MRPNWIKTLSAVSAAAVIGILGLLNVGTADALSLSNLNIGGVSINPCDFSSVGSIVSFVNANNGTATDVTSTDVLSSLGGSITSYQLANCGVSSTNTNHHIYGSCNDYWSNGLYDIRRGTPYYNAQLDTLGTGVICNRNSTPKVKVTGNADCTITQTKDKSYGTRLNAAIDSYNALVTDSTLATSDGGTTVTTAEQAQIDLARARVNDLRSSYDNNLGVLKVNCNQQQSNVVINNQVSPSGGSSVGSSSSSSGATTPRGSAETGDGSNTAVVAG